MSVATQVILVARKPADLDTLVAAAILAGKQPSGPIFNDAKGNLCQVMITGTVDGSLAALAAEQAQTVHAVDAAISPLAGTAVLTKGSAAAMTLAAPTADGVRKRIMVGSSFAHVVTATGLIQDGSNEAGNTITFAAKKGAAVILESYNSKWLVVASNHATVA